MTNFTSAQGVLEISALKGLNGVSEVKDAETEGSKGQKRLAHKIKT
jgi:hypothetical protein